ncbi:MAG: hypothetical protein F7C38_04085 [Desulfurococcales archaeon]|nr:hypothetical protein [Desulfurococcales archaeon]
MKSALQRYRARAVATILTSLIFILFLYLPLISHSMTNPQTLEIYYSVHITPIPPGTSLSLNDEGRVYAIALGHGYTLLMQLTGEGNIRFPEFFPGNSYASSSIKIMVKSIFKELTTKIDLEYAEKSRGLNIYYLNKADDNKLYVCKSPLVAKGGNFEVAFNEYSIPLKSIVELDTDNDGLADIAVIFDILYSNASICGYNTLAGAKAYIPLAGAIIIGIASIAGFKRFR